MQIFRLALLFFIILFPAFAVADEGSTVCESSLKAIAFQDEFKSPNNESGSSTSKYKLGLLVGLESGEKILGLAHYLSGHESIAREIRGRYGDIDEYFWGGEILMTSKGDQAQRFFSKVNETCGLIHDLKKHAPHNGHDPSKLNNSNHFLEMALNGACSNLQSQKNPPVFYNWNPAQAQHLHQKLNDSDANLRHSILNSFFILRSFGIDFLFRSPLHIEAKKTIFLMEKLLDLLDEDDFDSELIAFLREAHQLILNQKALNLRESHRLEKIYSSLEKSFQGFEKEFEAISFTDSLIGE